MHKQQNFNIEIHCLVLGTDLKNGQQYVLSLNENDIVLPSFFLDNNSKLDVEKNIVSYLNQYILCNELELMPQIISLHNESVVKSKKKNIVNTIYASVVNTSAQINNSYWIEFNFMEPTKYSNLIFEAIQKLK